MNFNPSKKEWVDEFKNTSNQFKLEERNLIQTFLKDDYHLMKIYGNLMKEEIEEEKRVFQEFLKQIKISIGDVYSYFIGAEKNISNKIRNYDVRDKIFKIEETLKKNKLEFKNKFEILLYEEENLERELNEFQEEKFRNVQKEDDENQKTKNDGYPQELITGHNEDKNKTINTFKKAENVFTKIDEYLGYILSDSNDFFVKFTDEEVNKLIQKLGFKDFDYIRNKISFIDYHIEKKIGGVNLSWQARDHQEFLRLKAIHNNKYHTHQFLNELENSLPFIPISELKNHIRQFSIYSQLFELKKQLIIRFKEIKSEIDETEKKEILEKISKDKKSHNPVTLKVDKEIIQQWKMKKLQEKKEKFEVKMKLENEKLEREKQKFNRLANENKELIENYKKEKSLAENRNYSTSVSIHREINEIDLQRIKEKNEKLIEKKMLVIRSKSVNKIRNSENYTKFKLKKMEKFEKIEPRLNQNTTGYELKKRNKFDPDKETKREASSMANNVLGHMSRATPLWRKGLL